MRPDITHLRYGLFVLLALAACFPSATLLAQCDQPLDLACKGQVNVTLNANCQFALPFNAVLAGEFACASAADFNLVVEDGTEANGGTVDGCGSYTYVISVAPGSSIQGFTTCWGIVRADDKTAPTVLPPTPPAGPLFCDQLDNISLTQLPFNVSRCYRTNSAGNFINAAGAPITAASLPGGFRNRILAGGGFPTVADNCSNVRVCVNDVLTYAPTNPECNDVVLTRTFTVTDDGPCTLPAGETLASATASYSIVFTRPALSDVNFSTTFIEISCDDNSRPLLPANQFGNANPVSLETEFPFLTTGSGPLYLDESFCNLAVTLEDGPRTVTCANTYKFFRTYTVADWCSPNLAPLEITRLVKVGDFTPPTILAPTQDLDFDGVPDNGLFFSTNSPGCLAFFVVPAPTVTDNCSAAFTTTANIYPGGNLNATPIGSFQAGQLTSGIPAGSHIIRYTSVDACANSASIDLPLTVGDASIPTAKCENGLNISIGGAVDGSGTAILTAIDVDNGSTDDCSGVTLAIACIDQNNDLVDPALGYQPSILLDCGDLGPKRVSLRVTDAAGNVNFCWLTVLVEDKSAPICIPPTPRAILCSDLPFDFPANVGLAFGLDAVNVGALLNDLFGVANGGDNCPGTTPQVFTPVDTRDNCGIGTISRSFRFTDAQGLQSPLGCTQLITVLEQHDYTIRWPGDSDSEDCEIDAVSLIGFEERACDLIAVSVVPDTFLATADECYKIRNTIEVINWCEYNGINDPITVPRDADGDNNLTEDFWLHVVPGPSAVTITDDVAFLDRDGNRFNGLPSRIGNLITPYGTDPRRGYFRYVQFIKVYDNLAPTIDTTGNQTEFCSFDGNLCAGDLSLTFNFDDACSPDAVSIVSLTADPFVVDANNDGIITSVEFMPGSLPATSNLSVGIQGNDMVIVGTNIPIGRHAIRLEISDGCGNRAAVIYVVEVIDCKAPTPICINGLTSTLMPDGNGGGMSAIWVSDFVASPSTDCTP
ncbi:MAG: hypothetical protein WBA17_01700, partial [Saprospiraceae bacterium]